MKLLTTLLLTIALLLCSVSCGGTGLEDSASSQSPAASSESQSGVTQPEALQPLTLPFYPDYSLHPALAENRANMALSSLLYEGLFTLDNTFTPVPVLCQSHSVSEDGLVWRFTLHSGLTFSDGTPLTGGLAAQSLTAALAPGSRFAGRITGLKSVTGDGNTVVVTLTTPNSALPALLDIPITKDSTARPLGTGPYILTQADNRFHLRARSDWWQAKALPFNSIPLFSCTQADDLIAAFDSGDVTLLEADLTGTNALGYSGSYEVWDYNTTQLIYLGFNTGRGLCKDLKARQAISRSIDRGSITTIPYARHAVPASLPVHPDSPLYDAALAQSLSYAPEVLVELLEGSGTSRSLTLVVNSENAAKTAAADYIAYQLQAAGLTVTVEKLPWDSFLNALRAGSFDLYLGDTMLTPDFDLTPLLSSAGSLNYSRWQDGQTDTLLAQLRQASGETRTQSAQALYSHLAQQSPIAPICFKYGCVLTQWGRLSGLSPMQNHIFSNLEQWALES